MLASHFFIVLDRDDVLALDRRVGLRDDHPDAGVDVVLPSGSISSTVVLSSVDDRLEQADGLVADLVGVLADGDVDVALREVVDGLLVEVEGDDGGLLAELGDLGDLGGDPRGVVRPEAEQDAEVGVLGDRDLDVRLGLVRVGLSSKISTAA